MKKNNLWICEKARVCKSKLCGNKIPHKRTPYCEPKSNCCEFNKYKTIQCIPYPSKNPKVKKKNKVEFGWAVYDTKVNRFIYVNIIHDKYNEVPENKKEFLQVNYPYTWRTKKIEKVKITRVGE